MCASRCAKRPRRQLGEVVHLKTWDYPGLVEAIEAAIPKLGATTALGDRLRRRAGRGAHAETHQCALAHRRPGRRQAAGPRAGAAAQRFRGAGAFAADDSRGLGAPHRPARLRRAGAAGHSRARHRARHRRADRGRRTLSRRSPRRPATSISARSTDGGMGDLAAPRTRARTHHHRKRDFRPRAGARASRRLWRRPATPALERDGPALVAAALADRGGEEAREPRIVLAHRRRASPATWRSPSSRSAA